MPTTDAVQRWWNCAGRHLTAKSDPVQRSSEKNGVGGYLDQRGWWSETREKKEQVTTVRCCGDTKTSDQLGGMKSKHAYKGTLSAGGDSGRNNRFNSIRFTVPSPHQISSGGSRIVHTQSFRPGKWFPSVKPSFFVVFFSNLTKKFVECTAHSTVVSPIFIMNVAQTWSQWWVCYMIQQNNCMCLKSLQPTHKNKMAKILHKVVVPSKHWRSGS